ncbi:TPA: ABC transporter permease [Candidatus Acetothermia bacterium]|nr:ABC transporter permease [Candidatus Acetothermia bacterium]HAZ30898.1 ABC transporter permease [Candidatus Acetothermia bacterium]
MSLLQAAVEQGLIYGLMALGVYISFRVLSFPDLSVDGTFPLGAAVGATLITSGWNPYATLGVAFAAGAVGGAFTAILATKFRIQGLLAGVLTMIMLYSLNLRIMGRPNLPLLGRPSVFRMASQAWGIPVPWANLVVAAAFALGAILLLDLLFRTEAGLTLRATGDNPGMVRAYGTSPERMVVSGLALANGLVALSGALAAQHMGFADVGLGVGTIVAALAAVIMGEILLRPRSVPWALLAVVVGSCLYRGAILLALRYGSAVGFTASDLRLVTALVVLGALVAPAWRLRREGAG